MTQTVNVIWLSTPIKNLFSLFRTWALPAVFGIAVISLVVFGIISKAKTATDYPQADAMQYLVKAKNVWEAIDSGNIAEIFNVPETFRPPGAALLLYPTGFKPSYQSFYARSTYIPIFIWIGALFLVLHPFATNSRQRYIIMSLCCGAGSLPMFYQFGTGNEAAFWGLVDPLFAAVSALAVALLINGATTKGRYYTLLGWMAAGFSLFIKPAGLVILLSCIGIWGVECLIRLRNEPASSKPFKDRLGYEIQSLVACIFIYTAFLEICLRTKYLASDTFNYFIGGSKLVISWVSSTGLSFSEVFYQMLLKSLGLIYILPLGIVVLVWLGRVVFDACKLRISASSLRTLSLLVWLGAAAYWWWTMSAPQTRYFYPFVLITILWIWRSIMGWMIARPVWLQFGVASYLLAPLVLVTTLLWLPTPPKTAQEFLGLNLTTSLFSEEAKLSDRLLKDSAALGKTLQISIVGSPREWAIAGHFLYQYNILGIKNSGLSGLQLCDWVRDPGLRFDELLTLDILLVDKTWIKERDPNNPAIHTYHEEISEFFRFLTAAPPVPGLELYQDGTLAAYRVVNRDTFASALAEWAGTVKWENKFQERNAAFLSSHR